MADEPTELIVREAGLLESFHIVRSRLGFDSCVVLAAKYNATGSLLNRQTLYPALASVILQHAALSVQVYMPSDPKAKPKFIRLPSVALDDVVSFVSGGPSEESLAKLIADELATPIEIGSSKPLWRLTVASGRTLLFSHLHGIADGQSGIAFHRSLLTALNSATLPVIGNDVPIPANLYLVPPVEALTDVSVSWRGFFQIFYDTFAPYSWTKKASAWTGSPAVSAPSLATHVRVQSLSAADTTALLALCRTHHTTLTAFFYTLLVGLLSRHAITSTSSDSHPPRTLGTTISVSLRPHTGASPHVLCDASSGIPAYEPLAPLASTTPTASDFPWPSAAALALRLPGEVACSREAIGTIRYLYALGITESFWTGALGRKRGQVFELSNLGRFGDVDVSSDAVWTLGGVYFAQCNAVVGAALKVNVAGAPGGEVSLVYTWGEGAIEDAVAEAVVEEVKGAIMSILASSA